MEKKRGDALHQHKHLPSVAATDLIVHIREHLPILLGTRVTAFREPQNRKAAK